MPVVDDLIIVGEGFAGLSCAAECARSGLKVTTIEAELLGGLVINVNELEQFQEAGGRSGMEQAATLAAANRKAGVKSVAAEVRTVVPVDGGFEVNTNTGKYNSRFVVIASGARLKSLGVPGELEFQGRGVSHCADCDAPMFSNAEVVVAGAGDWALKDALLLARESSTVHLVYKGSGLTACGELVDRVRAESKMQLHPGLEILEILGDAQGMTAVQVVDAEGIKSEIAAKGIFVLTGLLANSSMAPESVARDGKGFLKVDNGLETTVPGLWAIGQVRSGFGGWLNDAVADARLVAECLKARCRSSSP